MDLVEVSGGILPVAKPPGVSSRAVVDAVARTLRTKAVGHAGTLDPLAAGVVVCCLGKATRLIDFIHEQPKVYRAIFLLGRSSPSDDLETAVVEEVDPLRPTEAEIEIGAATQRGEILQRPCDYSAKQVDGKRAYRLARRGKAVALAPKRVRIDRLVVTSYRWPELAVEVTCSSGTFIRAIGRDLAAAVGTKAVMASLVRSAVGPFTVESAIPLAAVTPDDSGRGAVLAAVHGPRAAVSHLGCLELAEAQIVWAAHGGQLRLETTADPLAAVDAAGELVGILRRLEVGRYRLRPNFRGVN